MDGHVDLFYRQKNGQSVMKGTVLFSIQAVLWTAIYSVATAGSIVLLGQRDLVSGNLYSKVRIVSLLTHWKFLLSMTLALAARASFIMTNNALLNIPRLRESATTATTFITLASLMLTVVANVLFLKETFRPSQIVGMLLMMSGIVFISL